MYKRQGLDISIVSIIVSLAVLCEAPIVLFSHKFMGKIGNKKLFIIAFSLISFLYAIYAFDVYLPLQVLVTFLVKHPAGMLFIMINLKVVNTLVDVKYQITAPVSYTHLQLANDHIILIATHVVSDVETIAKEIIFLKKGEIVDLGNVSELLEKYQKTSLEDVYLDLFGDEHNEIDTI